MRGWWTVVAVVAVVAGVVWFTAGTPEQAYDDVRPSARRTPPSKPEGAWGPAGSAGRRCDVDDLEAAAVRARRLTARPDASRLAHGVVHFRDAARLPERSVQALRAGELEAGVRWTIATDADEVVGVALGAVPDDTVIHALGLRAGDVVGTVNGWQLGDIAQNRNAWRAVSEADVFCVDFFREGRWRAKYVVVDG